MTVLQGAVVDSSILADLTTPQGLATEWILNQDAAVACPDDPKFLQRWVLAVIYYSTNGDQWVQCSDNPAATDDCGNLLPFLGATRFLSAGTECDWAGITCQTIDGGLRVTQIELGKNHKEFAGKFLHVYLSNTYVSCSFYLFFFFCQTGKTWLALW